MDTAIPPLKRAPRRKAYIDDIALRPRFRALRATDGNFRHLAGGMEEKDKKRICVRYGGSADSYLDGVQNGHTVPVEQNPNGTAIRNPGVYCRATKWERACAILREGVRPMGRNDIHMAPLRIPPRQEIYLEHSVRKTHILTIDGTIAAEDGIKFFLLGNGVVASRGINGLLHP